MPPETDPETRPKRRLPPDERRAAILDKAVRIFAESGLDSSTHELARRIGVSQPLLYRYFPNKESLIREVYQRVYLARWQETWDQGLSDRSTPLKDRLKTFYTAYTEAVFSREWMRIYLSSGLRGAEINRWYIKMLQERVLRRIVIEFRHEAGLDDVDTVAPADLELAWFLHSGIFYMGVREHVYGLPVAVDRPATIAAIVDVVFGGMVAHFKRRRKV